MTIALLEQALVALSAPNHCVFSEPPICVDIRAALAASAHQEQLKPGECWPTHIMKQWDEMRDLISKGDKSSLPRDWFESLAEMRLIDAPTTAWHDAPTCSGLWFCDEGGENPYRFTCHDISMPLNPHLAGEGERWFGPIPPDGDKP